MLIKQTEKSTGLNYLNYPKVFIEISNGIEEYNPTKKQKIVIVFDDMIADRLSNKKLNPVVIKKFKYFPFLLRNLILLFQKR